MEKALNDCPCAQYLALLLLLWSPVLSRGQWGTPLTSIDIGNPSPASVTTVLSDGLDVVAGGQDIGGTADQFSFNYQAWSGDFDLSLRLSSLGLSDLWAKGGLLARESLDAGSRFAGSLATPAMNGAFFEYRDPTNSPANATGSFPINYPNTWLRLQRLGSRFAGFASYDGLTWTRLGSVDLALSNLVYVGVALCSHNSGQPTLAQFRDLEKVGAAAAVGTLASPHEALGPCSRKTPIVISELMYHPAPRADGNNLEFVEVYNSNPWFHDLSGYRLVGAALDYTFPSGTIIAGGGFLVIAASPPGLQSVTGITNVVGPYIGSLRRPGTLQLRDEQGAVLLTVPYANVYPWPVAADGTGHSLVLARPTYGEADPRAWDISDVVGGSPGTREAFRPSPLRSVVINELLAHSENPQRPQFVELYNHSNRTNDLSGCVLSDEPGTNKFIIPPGTRVAPGGFVAFDQSQLGFVLNGAGGTIYFINPDGSRVLDARQFEAQADGVSFGRWPDGADDFYPLVSGTPGTNNSAILIGDIVINELMYEPISGNDDDQYVELYNQGTNPVSLANWRLTAGVSFTFPPDTTLAPNGYLVVGRNLSNLLAKYTYLNPTNALGNYGSKLAHKGERVALARPQSYYGTNTIWVVEDEVTYGTGGRWGQWAAGGGSSLELIDPHANHRLAANWADSDETQKSAWVTIEHTGVLDNGRNADPTIDFAQIGLLDAGECLVDDVEVDFNGVNYVSNSDFEGGADSWSFQGDMVRSSLENGGYGSGQCLHIRCSDRLWTGVNSCEVGLNANSLGAGQVATLRFKARWLHGWPEVLLRLSGNWLEATGPMPIPPNLGTPGLPNSRYVTNAGPALYEVTHTPAVPAADQPVVVSARAHDPDGVQGLVLNYRIDPAATYTAVAMSDNGEGGDAIAGDGVFSATIPGQAGNSIAAFYISATDARGAATRFPALLADNSPVRECVVMFGDGNPGGSFGVYHLWLTQASASRWSDLPVLSNEGNDCTFVNGNRVIYNMQGRYAGSPWHQDFDSPYGNLCFYKWIFNDDDKFLGATSFNKIHQPGNVPGEDLSLQREQTAYLFMRALGVPWLNRRYVALYVNGHPRGPLTEDTQCPDADMIDEYFPDDTVGFLYKMAPWYEFPPLPTGPYNSIEFDLCAWCELMPFTTTGGVKKTASYRYTFEPRRTADSANNFTNVFSLVDAASSYGTPNYVANMENLADMENWMRVFAANHAAGNWDTYGSSSGQNLYGYIGSRGTKYSLLMFDFNVVLGTALAWGPGQNLFTVNPADSNTGNIFNEPTFRRMYWRALGELVNGPLNVANSGPLLDAKYDAFVANGLNVEDPATGIKPWLAQARSSIAAQLSGVDARSFAVNPSVTVSNAVAWVSGTAPVAVKTVWLNGVAWPISWTSLTWWTVAVPLQPGTNRFNVVGVDRHGQPVPGASGTVTVVYLGAASSPVGQVVINEIMCSPVVFNSEYVELLNTSTNITFDLSGWQFQGLAYTFPAGSLIGPEAFLVLAVNRAAFAAAYGATVPVFDTYTGSLQPGQTLALAQPGSNGASNVVAQVRYEGVAPWPVGANGSGSSLQLIDPHQDNWRVGNWAVNATPGLAASPGKDNTVLASLPAFPTLWINELQADNLTGITNSAGQRAAWLELYNPSTNPVPLDGLYLANTFTNLRQWAFPSGALLSPGGFKVIFADGQTNLSTPSELHTSFGLPSGAGALALSRVYNDQPQVLDYVSYTNLSPNHSYGSFPDGQSFTRQEFFHPTPGGTNDGSQVGSFIAYGVPGSVYAQDFNSLPNPGAASVNAANPVTINGVTYWLLNPFDFALPAGGLGLPAMAGWFGLADPSASVGVRFGASDGDQTTGGQISFGQPNSTNRALGLLATSTTGFTAFGARVLNATTNTLNLINLQFTGEVWRQSDKAKTLTCYYYIDSSGASSFTTNCTAALPSLNVAFPGVAADVGGLAVDGTSPLNQTNLSAVNQVITNWLPGAVLWLVWEMADSDGKAQGLAIDSLSFSALAANPPPVLAPISNRVLFLGQTLNLTASATDADPPSQTLTFSLGPGAPPGAVINAATGQFTWTPTNAPSTNALSIVVTDSGIPNLSATQSFTVIVLPPQLGNIQVTGDQFSFTWLALASRHYQVEYKEALGAADWVPLGPSMTETNGLLTFTNAISASRQRYFRLRVLP